MAKWTIGSYNRFLAASMTKHKLTRKEAAQCYREMRAKLNHPVFRNDLIRHPRIAGKAAERARLLKPTPPPVREGPPIPVPEVTPEELKFIDEWDEGVSSTDTEGAY